MSLILFLPAFTGDAQVSPDEISDNSATPNATYDFDGNTIDIIEQTAQSTQILLNDTYQLDLTHNDTDLGVLCTKLDTGLVLEADEMLFDVNFQTNEDGQSLKVDLPDFSISLESSGPNNDEWNGTIIGAPEFLDFSYNTTSNDLEVFDGVNKVYIKGDTLIINDGLGLGGCIVSRINDTAWDILSPVGIITVNWNPSSGVMGVEYIPLYNYYGPILQHGTLYTDPFLIITLGFNGICVEWAGTTIYVHAYTFVLIFDYITITWYFAYIITRIVLLIWDITIIIYLTIVELLIVIIYYTFEIKIYEMQIVIVYMFIEIIIVFISIYIWEFTFIFHFEFWFIEIIYIIDITLITIITPIRFVFIPVIVPVFIPVIFFVPVFIINYIHIYVPYASPALHIDVALEDLQMPTHTIQYFVYDEAGNPVDDATVIVNYDGSDYPATFISNGKYEVQLPASDYAKIITVTASKSWYPNGILVYELEVDWIIDTITLPTNITVTETETPTALIPIVAVVASLFCMAIGTVILKRKKM